MSSYLTQYVSATDNYSVYSLPLYWLLCIVPHGVAIAIASQGKPLSKWDNRNPRSEGMKTGLRNKLGEAKYAMYERAEAAHYNSLESFPLLATAVAFGNIARLPVAELNTFVVASAALRAVHQIVYIRTSTKLPTIVRTLVWYLQVSLSLRLLWRAAGATY